MAAEALSGASSLTSFQVALWAIDGGIAWSVKPGTTSLIQSGPGARRNIKGDLKAVLAELESSDRASFLREQLTFWKARINTGHPASTVSQALLQTKNAGR